MNAAIPNHADYDAHSGSCPDCGHDGPHTVQSDGFGTLEFSCEGCGLIHELPPSAARRIIRGRRARRAGVRP